MKKVFSLALFALALSTLPGLPGLALADEAVNEKAAPPPDQEAEALAKRGKALRYTLKTVAPASPIDTGAAAIYIDAPLATVKKVVTDYRHYSQFIHPFQQSRLLSRKKGVSEVYLEVPVMHGAATIWCVVLFDPPSKDAVGETIVARYSRGNVDDFRAVWRLRAVDDTHTIAKLELLVDPKLPIPGPLLTPELSSAADKAVTAVRDRAQNPQAVASEAPPSPGAKTDDDAQARSPVAKR